MSAERMIVGAVCLPRATSGIGTKLPFEAVRDRRAFLRLLGQYARFEDGEISTDRGNLEISQRMTTNRFKVASTQGIWFESCLSLQERADREVIRRPHVCDAHRRHCPAVCNAGSSWFDAAVAGAVWFVDVAIGAAMRRFLTQHDRPRWIVCNQGLSRGISTWKVTTPVRWRPSMICATCWRARASPLTRIPNLFG
jgi:hypothetical protein